MTFNRFIAQNNVNIPNAEVEELETIESSEDSDTGSVDPISGKKPRKQSKPREKKNVTIEKDKKAEILKRYANETPAAIARDMGLEPRQVYNIVRNTRLKLEESIKQCDESIPEHKERKQKLEAALSRIPHKEFGGGTGGPRSNTMTEDDTLASLLS